MGRVLIAGCGDVGTALGLALAADGHEVWGLRRDPSRLPDPIRRVAADLSDRESLSRLPGDVETLVYAAAAVERTDEGYARAYVDGPRHARDALLGCGAPLARMIFVSSTGVYAQAGGEWVDEESGTAPEGFAGRRLLEGERLVLDGAVRGTVVRFGGIYGPGRERLVREVRRGATCVEDPPRWTNRIHRDDCAGVLRHLHSLAAPEPIYVGVDDAPAPQCEVMDWLAREVGAPAPRRVPAQGARARGSKRCRNARLKASGYRLVHPTYREGYRAVLRGEGVRYR